MPLGGDALIVHAARIQMTIEQVRLDVESRALTRPDLPTVTYRRRRLVVPGWKFVLDVYTTWPDIGPAPDGIVLPGHVTGVPGERSTVTDRPEQRAA
jgi:hypothetical protein